MNADTIASLNFIVHSLVIGAAAWLLVRFIIRDALRRCILANFAVLMCLFSPQNISFQDLRPAPPPVSVLTPIQETFKADWRITVTPAVVTTTTPSAWNVNEVVKVLGRLSWLVTAALLLRLVLQSIGVQRWAWRLRRPSMDESGKLPPGFDPARIRVFEHEGTPCVAGWFFPVIAVPVSAFEKLTIHQWRWLLRHEGEHLRIHDTVVVLVQKIVRSFLWWNPFAHALIEEYARAREEACDAAAVGEDADHTAYADFLLTWAAQSLPQSGCVMPISHSRPARRLKLRLVALMEARGVRKKLGAFFVLACVAFAFIAPLIAASFGIATASAQETTKQDDGTLNTRVYIVAPDLLNSPVVAKTARELLEQRGVPFPPGASAIYLPTTSQLIVRNTRTNIQLIEAIIDQLHTVPAMVKFTCRLIQADRFLGAHESILSPEEAQALIRSMSQKRGVSLLSAPSLSTRFDQGAAVEVVREVPPKVLPGGSLSGEVKFVGPSIKLLARPPVHGKSPIEVKVDLGLDPDSATRWLPDKDKPADWDRVQIHTVSSQASLAGGETLLLHLPTSEKPVTVLISATALKQDGGDDASFTATTMKAPPASQGRDMPKKEKKDEWHVREYRVPAGFGGGRMPAEYLEANGVIFPQGASAEQKDGRLTVRNTRGNLDLIEALIESHLAAGLHSQGQVQLKVHAVDARTDDEGLMALIFPETKKEQTAQPSLNMGHQFILQGVMTDPQFQSALQNLTKSGSKPASLPHMTVKGGKEAVFDMPAEAGGSQLKVTPEIGRDGQTVNVTIQPASLDPASQKIMTTSVSIWNGQTVMMAGQPAGKEKTMRVIFITASLIDPLGDPVKK